jgi:hypothetical protein
MTTELTTEQIELLFGERLDSTIFTGDNYCCYRGYGCYDIYNTDKNINELALINDKYECRGWCYAGSLIMRSRPEGIAIMLWHKKNREEIWCHCSLDMLGTLFNMWMITNDVDENGKKS